MKYLLLAVFLGLTSCSPCQKFTRTITKVGGCDRFGNCGVMYDDGKTGTEFFPIEGQTIKRCWYK